MARVKFGLAVADMRGKLGGGVFTRNRAGSIVRTKVTPKNPATIKQTSTRQIFSYAAQAWRNLTLLIVQGFTRLAKEVSATNVFGDRVQLTAFNLWVRLNSNLVLIGEELLTTVPVLVPSTPMTTMVVTTLSVSVVTLTFTPATVPTNNVLAVAATRSIRAGRLRTESDFRIIKVAPTLTVGVYTATTDYLAVFGEPVVGEYVYFRCFTVQDVCGMQSLPLEASKVVA